MLACCWQSPFWFWPQGRPPRHSSSAFRNCRNCRKWPCRPTWGAELRKPRRAKCRASFCSGRCRDTPAATACAPACRSLFPSVPRWGCRRTNSNRSLPSATGRRRGPGHCRQAGALRSTPGRKETQGPGADRKTEGRGRSTASRGTGPRQRAAVTNCHSAGHVFFGTSACVQMPSMSRHVEPVGFWSRSTGGKRSCRTLS